MTGEVAVALETNVVRSQALSDALTLEDLGISWTEYEATPQDVLVYQTELRHQRAARAKVLADNAVAAAEAAAARRRGR